MDNDQEKKGVPSLLLVLDLHGTLINEGENLRFRPGLQAFFDACKSLKLHLAIWTAASCEYGLKIEDLFRTQFKANFEFVWGGERCLKKGDYFNNEMHIIKPLKKIWRQASNYWTRRNVLILDDTKSNTIQNRGNWIPISSWNEESQDKELERISLLLKEIVEQFGRIGDVRTCKRK